MICIGWETIELVLKQILEPFGRLMQIYTPITFLLFIYCVWHIDALWSAARGPKWFL